MQAQLKPAPRVVDFGPGDGGRSLATPHSPSKNAR